jgi:hypothetical protein
MYYVVNEKRIYRPEAVKCSAAVASEMQFRKVSKVVFYSNKTRALPA